MKRENTRILEAQAVPDRCVLGSSLEGNPAAVVPLESWLPDALLQSIVSENNLSETAFFVPSGPEFQLQWFTPACEVDLCGHATLASAHVLFRHLGYPGNSLVFDTRSGDLVVKEKNGLLVMDFPARPPKPCPPPDKLIMGLGNVPVEVLTGQTCIAVFEGAEDLRSLNPDHAILGSLDWPGIAVTAPGGTSEKGIDFVSRYFAPKVGVSEDPVTGSSHCALAPTGRSCWEKT
ncbi:MAG: PhzF family phenazine biosynthesis isomerase [Nitrospiraceae bacterium]|nr:PhzF family phenazine biosynthesis isomerase [Nitrospiraceae bacterium]